MKTLLVAIVGLGLLAAGWLTYSAYAAESPKVGDAAPPISGQDQDGKEWKLADAAGKSIVLLYFYPKDDTPGCTKQACGLRDRMADLKKDGVEVVGVSFDSSESHQKFIAKHSLNFRLLADPEGKIVDAYGVRRAAGLKFAKRVSFLISKDGKIVHITDNGSADVHLAEMKDAVAKLTKH
jgi:thioredoxin-dependent peroxiredoxin